MSLKIRLSRAGSKKRPYYHVVVADARSPRDGRFIETLGSWNPLLPRDGERVKVDADRVKRVTNEFGARAVTADEIYSAQADIFAPCALGAIINDKTIPRLQVEIVAGAANNQLLEERHGDALEQRKILYAPDYVANAGGVINVYSELAGWTPARAFRKADEIYDTLLKVFSIAKAEGIPTYLAADRLAEQRIQAVGSMVRTWPQWPNK